MEPAEADADGVPIVNTAGDPIEGVMIHRDRLLINIKYWSVNITVEHIQNYWNVLNEDEWYGFPPETLLVVDYGFQSVYETMEGAGGGTFIAMMYECNIQLEFKPTHANKWDLKVLNQGLRELVGGEISHIKDRSGADVTTPVPLSTAGEALPPYGDGTGTPNYLTFQMYPTRNFAAVDDEPGLIV